MVQRVEVPLKFDNEFFGILQNDVTILDAIMETEQQVLTREIVALSADIAAITKPSKYSRSDLYRWRELFEIYLEAAPFFSTRECDFGKRNSTTAAKKLQWFQSEVTKRGLVSNFKLPASLRVLDRFVALNIALLQNMSYQEINQKAVVKIIKSEFPPSACTPFWVLSRRWENVLTLDRVRQTYTTGGFESNSKACPV